MANKHRTGTLRHLDQRVYRSPAPKSDEKVAPAYWTHRCAYSQKEEWNSWQGGPYTCINYGYTTSPATILRNRDGQQLETVEGENLLEDRFVDWWANCCQFQRWQENVLPAHSLYGRIFRAVGQNCCHHCRHLSSGMGNCTNCVVITKYGELTRTMSGSHIAGGAQDRHLKAVLASCQRERSKFHPSFYGQTDSTTSQTTGETEDKKLKREEEQDKEENSREKENVKGRRRSQGQLAGLGF